jgi:hypothetical protein
MGIHWDVESAAIRLRKSENKNYQLLGLWEDVMICYDTGAVLKEHPLLSETKYIHAN